MSTGIKHKALRSVAWNLAERFGVQGISLVLAVILVRLLTPEDFGLIGIVSAFFLMAEVFAQGGLGQAYVQKKTVSQVDANTVFFANVVIGLACYFLLWLLAPRIAAFYQQPLLVELVRVMGVIIVFNALRVIQVAKLTRALEFSRKAKVALFATSVSGLLGVGAALLEFGVWSLVVQQVSNASLATAGYWFVSSWRPDGKFSSRAFRRLFSFGGWVMASGLMRAVFDNLYILVIGRLFPMAQVGFYTRARTFQRVGSEQIVDAVGSVAFPIFSRVQEDKPRLKAGMQQFTAYTLLFIAPLMVLLLVVAKPLVILLLTEKWEPVIPYFQMLCLLGILYPLHASNILALQSQGRSDLNFRLAVIKNLMRVANIAIMWRWGVFYIVLGEVVVSFIALVVNTHYTRQFLGYGLWQQLRDTGAILLSSMVAGLIAYAVFLGLHGNSFVLPLVALVMALAYLLLQYFCNRNLLLEVLKLRRGIGGS